LLLTVPGSERSVSLGGLFAAGDWTLGMTRVDQYGNESDPDDATISLEVDGGGNVATQLIDPSNVYVEAIAGGAVRVEFHAVQPMTPGSGAAQQVMATEFEVADAADLSTILATITRGNQTVIRETLAPGGGFSHGQKVRLYVRASDGASNRGPWVAGNVVAADSEAPVVPQVFE
jgi:hypothetical protein